MASKMGKCSHNVANCRDSYNRLKLLSGESVPLTRVALNECLIPVTFLIINFLVMKRIEFPKSFRREVKQIECEIARLGSEIRPLTDMRFELNFITNPPTTDSRTPRP